MLISFLITFKVKSQGGIHPHLILHPEKIYLYHKDLSITETVYQCTLYCFTSSSIHIYVQQGRI